VTIGQGRGIKGKIEEKLPDIMGVHFCVPTLYLTIGAHKFAQACVMMDRFEKESLFYKQ